MRIIGFVVGLVTGAFRSARDRFGPPDMGLLRRLVVRLQCIILRHEVRGDPDQSAKSEIQVVCAFHAASKRWPKLLRRAAMAERVDLTRLTAFLEDVKNSVFADGDMERGDADNATPEERRLANEARLAMEWTAPSAAAENALRYWRAHWKRQAEIAELARRVRAAREELKEAGAVLRYGPAVDMQTGNQEG